ncbi:MAG: 8-oxo-dGTP diphosphatase [Clostridia bacterium]|jgi:8-oxo-dGTP diphosphatase|nr:8-oxo-dGTP diphosphatase [Clostridia bacterium]
MSRTENVELTVLCLIEDGDRLLLQNRIKEDWQGYTLPGGHVEPGESFVDAVIREMKEETGLTVIEPRLVGVKQFPIKDGRYVVLLFKAEKWSGELVSSAEGQMEWIAYSSLSGVNTVNDLADLLKVMNTPELTEFQYLVSGDEWTVSIR